MSSFDLVSQMIVEQRPWIVTGLICIALTGMAIFFGAKSKDNDNLDDEDEDDSSDQDRLMKLWGPGVLSVKLESRKIELAREALTAEHDPNNSGLERAIDANNDELANLSNQWESKDDVSEHAEEVFVDAAEEPFNEKETDKDVNEKEEDDDINEKEKDDTISLEQPIEDHVTVNYKEMIEDKFSLVQPSKINDFESPMVKSSKYAAEKSSDSFPQKKKKSTWSKIKGCFWKKSSKSKRA